MSYPDTERLTFYFPQARALSPEEIAALPPDRKQAAATAVSEGVWLEIPCPQGSCVAKDGKVSLPVAGTQRQTGKGLWLNVFCPEDSCLWAGGTDLV